MKIGVALIVTLVFSVYGWCDDAPGARVEIRLDPPGELRTGQSAQLVVDIWVTTWFLQAPQMPDLKIDGAAVSLPDAADHLREQKEGVEWFGIRRTYVITATLPGEMHVPALEITVHPGPDGQTQTLRTDALDIAVKGAASGAGSSLVTTHLDLTQAIQTSAQPLKVGESITRTLTQTAAGTQAMLLPPLHFKAIDGLALYPAPARVENLTDGRGAMTGGRRVDAATYVAQRAGNYTLPAQEVHWWDPSTQTLRTASAPAVKLKVIPPPRTHTEFTTPTEPLFPKGLYSYVFLLFWVLLVSALLWYGLYLWTRYWPRLQNVARQWRRRRENSEGHAWARLRALEKSREPIPVYRALTLWVAHLPGAFAGPKDFAARSGDTTLHAEITRLEQILYAGTNENWSAATLVRRCKLARRDQRRAKQAAPRALQPLNPD